MKKLVAKFESNSNYKLENLPPDYLEKQLKGIVGFRIRAEKIEASYKLAQTLDPVSYESVISHLENSPDANSQKIAEVMAERRK